MSHQPHASLSHAAVITLTTAAFIVLTTLAFVTSKVFYCGKTWVSLVFQLHTSCILATNWQAAHQPAGHVSNSARPTIGVTNVQAFTPVISRGS